MTPKETVWYNEYFICFNATEAARRADFKWPNKAGPRLKKKFEKEIKAHLEEMTMTADEALYHLSLQARANIGEYVSADGLDIVRMKADGLEPVIKSAKRVKTQYDDRLEVEIYDKQSALDKILRAHGAYKDNLDVTSQGERVKFIDYGLKTDDIDNTESD